ncbi:MAG: thiamine diphosphokinase [Acholeplasmataceae bacterium]
MNVIIITYPTPKDIKKIISINADDYIISVDQATAHAKQQGIDIDLAVGDFDSLNDLSILNDINCEKLNVIKDVTDTHYALIKAMAKNPDAIYLIGGMGGDRIEHFFAHTLLFDLYPKLIMKDELTEIRRIDQGVFHTTFDGHISIFAYPRALISLKGFKYPLLSYDLNTYDPLGISNELTAQKGDIHVHEGAILVFLTKK